MDIENKTTRRILILNQILRPLQSKLVKTSYLQKEIEINKPPTDLQYQFNVLFTQQSLTFLSQIVSEFDQHIDQLYRNRLQTKNRYNSNFEPPKFLNTPQRRDKHWKINPLPLRLLCRHIDLGDVSPANTEHLVSSLKSNVQGIQIDFDDGHCPTWRNQILGLYNVYCVVHGLFSEISNIDNLPVLMLRPRAWNMIENNIMINGKKIPGPLVDFALLMFHNGKKLCVNNNGPFFYLSKLEGASEAKLWNDIFIWTQNRLNIPHGTIKACVLIENILSSFEMHEILFELKNHSMGLNCGIWDYAASIINIFGDNPNFILPDRNKYVNMDKHFLKKYMELVIETCHSRGAPATGGMAAQLLLEENKSETIDKVLQAKSKEIIAGCDGFLIYDRKFIPKIKQLWKFQLKSLQNQVSSDVTMKTNITEEDLLQMPSGTVTMIGLRHNIQIAILFIYHWFQGKGHFFYKGSVEDSATAEISRSQIWQWIRHKAKLEDNNVTVTKTLVDQMSVEFIKECVSINQSELTIAKEMFLDIVTARYFVNFITTYINDSYVFKKQQY